MPAKPDDERPHQRARSTVEEELRRERDFIAAVLTTAGALVVVLDPRGQIVRFNKACEQLTGYRFEDVRGRRFWEFLLTPEESARVQSVFDTLRSGHFPNRHENHWVTRDGGRRLILWSNTALLDAHGSVEFVVGTGIDVTERRRVTEELRESERKYRRMVEALHEGIWVIDETGCTTFVNDRMAEMLGYDADEMLGQHLFSFMDERGKEICERNLERRKQGIREDHEFELIHKNGTRVYTLMHTSPIPEADGGYRGALAGVLNITDRKLAENALQEAHAELEQRVRSQTQELRDALAEVERLKERLEEENLVLREEISDSTGFDDIIGESPALKRVLHRVDQVASTESSVLISGETGTGKELIAHAIHKRSSRKNRSLIRVNCAALPGTLIETELFGHEKGAFTGAQTARVGRFEIADGATIFLDEIGDLPLELQPKLLRVLQDGEFERVGSARSQRVDMRVIAASNRDLEADVRRGTFRADLYFRLGVFPITVPPLRERREDIPLLVWYFISKFRGDVGKRIENVPKSVMEMLTAYEWPGNVRELQNVIERALILSPGSTLVLDEFFGLSTMMPVQAAASASLSEIERTHILRVVEECGWRIKGKRAAAERLGLKPSTLRDRMKRLGIERPPRPS